MVRSICIEHTARDHKKVQKKLNKKNYTVGFIEWLICQFFLTKTTRLFKSGKTIHLLNPL